MGNFPRKVVIPIDIRTSCPSSEFSQEFIQGMVDRMAVSYHKYGLVADAYPDKVNALDSMAKRLRLYRETGNTEWLIDAANFLMIEFMCPRHDDAHFQATDSDASPGRVTSTGETTARKNEDITD